MKWFKIFYNCFMWAMIIALTCFQNTWLQMRVNTGYIFYSSWLILTLVLGLVLRKRQLGTVFSIINLIFATGYGLFLFGWKRLQIVPASLLREGIHQTAVKFSVINRIVLLFIVIGMLLIIMDAVRVKQVIIKDT